MRIGVDVMGGDNAPDEILKGALEALDLLESDDVLVLAGDPAIIADGMSERGVSDSRVEVLECGDFIEMNESPVEAVRAKRDSSIVKLSRLAWPQSRG